MDLIDKIERIQYYSKLPFGELFDESIFFKNVIDFTFNNNNLFNSFFTTNDGYLGRTNVKPEYRFKFEISASMAEEVKSFKPNIIIKEFGKYVLIKDVRNLSFDRVTDNRYYDTNPYFPNRYDRINNYNSRSSRIMIDTYINNRIIVTGIAKEIIINNDNMYN